jgi:hypothetical protein
MDIREHPDATNDVDTALIAAERTAIATAGVHVIGYAKTPRHRAELAATRPDDLIDDMSELASTVRMASVASTVECRTHSDTERRYRWRETNTGRHAEWLRGGDSTDTWLADAG